MDSRLPSEEPRAIAHEQAPDTLDAADGRLHCAICEHRLGKTFRRLDEGAYVPDSGQSWALCAKCYQAVQRQIAAAPVRSPLRVRVAVGIVASERTPAARQAHWDDWGERMFEHVLPVTIALAVIVHLITLVFIVVVVR